MRRRMLTVLLLFCLCFAGCGEETDTKIRGSQVWTEGLPLTWGQLEGEKLTVLPWDSGRAEATSKFAIAETRDGYYMGQETRLLYADKADLTLWVPVCNQPNCKHISMYNWSLGQIRCNAEIGHWGYYLKDDRIWTVMLARESAEGEKMEELVSMAPDGTDKRVEITDEKLLDSLTTPVSSGGMLLPWVWLYSIEDMQQDGSRMVHCYRHDGSSWTEYHQTLNETESSGWMISITPPMYMYGDAVIRHRALSTRNGDYERLLEDGYEIINLPTDTGYLAGDIFRYYKQNDGYYDFNIRTREEVKLAEPQLENSYAHIFLPNCIVESTLLTDSSLNTRTPGMTHTLEVFDGQQWHTVILPAELQNSEKTYLLVQAVTSDSILFSCRKKSSGPYDISELYRIDLTRDTWELEYITQIRDGL